MYVLVRVLPKMFPGEDDVPPGFDVMYDHKLC